MNLRFLFLTLGAVWLALVWQVFEREGSLLGIVVLWVAGLLALRFLILQPKLGAPQRFRSLSKWVAGFVFSIPILPFVGPHAEVFVVKLVAMAGQSNEQCRLGDWYNFGKEHPHFDYTMVAENHRIAVEWYRKAAIQGDVQGQMHLSSAYANGRGIPRNMHEAIKWCLKAADQNDDYAKKRLRELLEIDRASP